VERWMMRELSAPARLAALSKDALAALKGLAKLAEGIEHRVAPPARRKPSAIAIWALVVSVLALLAAVFAAGAALRL
jgi:hypothetical protein